MSSIVAVLLTQTAPSLSAVIRFFKLHSTLYAWLSFAKSRMMLYLPTDSSHWNSSKKWRHQSHRHDKRNVFRPTFL